MGCFSSKHRRYISEEGEAVIEEKMEHEPKVKKKAQTAIEDLFDDDSDDDTAEILLHVFCPLYSVFK